MKEQFERFAASGVEKQGGATAFTSPSKGRTSRHRLVAALVALCLSVVVLAQPGTSTRVEAQANESRRSGETRADAGATGQSTASTVSTSQPDCDATELRKQADNEQFVVKDNPRAIELYEASIACEPNAWAYMNMGPALSHEDRDDDAEIGYLIALTLNPTPIVKYRILAQHAGVHLKRGDYQLAIDRATESIAVPGGESYRTVFAIRAEAHEKLGQFDEALADRTKVIENAELLPHWHNYYARGLVYGHLGNWRAAIADYEQALEVNPSRTEPAKAIQGTPRCFSFPVGVESEQICITGAFSASGPQSGVPQFEVEAGGVVDLPDVALENLTNRPMRFVLQWNATTGTDRSNGRTWGSDVVTDITLEPGEKVELADLVFDAQQLTQLGSGKVTFGWSASGSLPGEDEYVVTSQKLYELVARPAESDPTIVVPVRLCVIEGSRMAGGGAPGSTLLAHEFIDETVAGAAAIWHSQAGILFRPAFASNGIPIIEDVVRFDNEELGQIGDIPAETRLQRAACETAWSDMYPRQTGLVAVVVRDVVDRGSIIDVGGLALGPHPSLQASRPTVNSRGDDLCGFPRDLTAEDVANQYIFLTEPLSIIWEDRDPSRTLAHELGHALLLTHGNGLDDDQDGFEPPSPGPRRFDRGCDMGGGEIEADSPSLSLMSTVGPPRTLVTALQIEQARDVAMVYPFALFS